MRDGIFLKLPLRVFYILLVQQLDLSIFRQPSLSSWCFGGAGQILNTVVELLFTGFSEVPFILQRFL